LGTHAASGERLAIGGLDRRGGALYTLCGTLCVGKLYKLSNLGFASRRSSLFMACSFMVGNPTGRFDASSIGEPRTAQRSLDLSARSQAEGRGAISRTRSGGRRASASRRRGRTGTLGAAQRPYTRLEPASKAEFVGQIRLSRSPGPTGLPCPD
jgi:hypothetical protein